MSDDVMTQVVGALNILLVGALNIILVLPVYVLPS